MPKVLVVEDQYGYFEQIKSGLDGKAEVLHAATLDKADELFFANPDIDVVIMDACVPGDDPSSMPLVEKIRGSGFQKPIIACSSASDYRAMLIEAGASHESGKYGAGRLALELLGLV